MSQVRWQRGEPGPNAKAELTGCQVGNGECRLSLRQESAPGAVVLVTAKRIAAPTLTLTPPRSGTIVVDPPCAAFPCTLEPNKEYSVKFDPKDSFKSWIECPGQTKDATCTFTAQVNRDYTIGVTLGP